MAKRLRIEDQIEKSRNLGNWESLREGKIPSFFAKKVNVTRTRVIFV